MTRQVKEGLAGALIAAALLLLGLLLGFTAAGDTQEQLGRVLAAAGGLGLVVALLVTGVSLVRGDRKASTRD